MQSGRNPPLSHKKLCTLCQQPDSVTLAEHTCHYHLQSVVWRAEAPSSREFPAEAISTLWQHQGSLLVLFPSLLPELPCLWQGSTPSPRAKDCCEHFAWLQHSFSGCSCAGMQSWMKDRSSRQPPPAHHNKKEFIHHCLKPIKEATRTGNMAMLCQTANDSTAPSWQSLYKGTPLL